MNAITLPGSASDLPSKKKDDTGEVVVMIGGELRSFTVNAALKLASQLVIGVEVAIAKKT